MVFLDSSYRQGNWFLQNRNIDLVPDIRYCGECSNLLSNTHVFRKNRSKNCVCFFPLAMVSKADEEIWSRIYPSNRTPSYGWTIFYRNFLKRVSLGFQCSLNYSKRGTKRSLMKTEDSLRVKQFREGYLANRYRSIGVKIYTTIIVS